MRIVDTSCWCVGLALICLIIVMCMQTAAPGATRQLLGAMVPVARPLDSGAEEVADARPREFTEGEFPERNEAFEASFTWDAMATKATDGWNIPSTDGAKRGQTVMGGRLGSVEIRPCRLPGIDAVSALRPPVKPITMGQACVSWGDSECRVAAIDRDTGCLDNAPNCGLSSR